jgi:hypothetical protein
MSELSIESRIKPSDDVLFQELQGEAVLLDLKTGVYFGLDRVGARMWQLFTANDSLRGVVRTIVNEYDVAEPRCTTDVLDLVTRLQDQGLIAVE